MTPIVVETEKTATLSQLVEKLGPERVVYVGETHTAYGDHLLQLEILRGMADQPGELALGVEWIQARFQPQLDSYLKGESSEADFLRGIEYYSRWRFDYRLYRPIIEFARERGIPVIALNASAELTAEIRKIGIEALSGELRGELPDGYDYSDQVYEQQLRAMFESHPSQGRPFERFLENQLTWDETMAQNVARYLNGGEQRRMLVMAGKGHINGRRGIPNRVERRTGLAGKTVGTFSPDSRMFTTADFMVLANPQSLPPSGLMRVLLDDREEGVYVKGFSEGSPAEDAGMRTDDRMLSIDGTPVDTYLDIRLAMADKRPGDTVEVVVERSKLFRGEKTETLTFDLVSRGSAH